MANNNKSKQSAALGTGLGLAALAAAAAGAYYFYGSKNATKNRAKLKGWAVKARGEVMERMEKLKEVTQENYDKVVDDVAGKYHKIKTISPEEIGALTSELKSAWNRISRNLKAEPARTRKPARRKTK